MANTTEGKIKKLLLNLDYMCHPPIKHLSHLHNLLQWFATVSASSLLLHLHSTTLCIATMSVYLRVFACMCAGSDVFHSWIKPGQCPRGLQVNAAYFKRLFLHGHIFSSAHMNTPTCWYIFPQEIVLLKSAYASLVTMLSCLNLQSLPFSVTSVLFPPLS